MYKQTTGVYLTLCILFTGFIVYLGLRIVNIPITHDEAGTILNFSTQPVWDIVTYKDPIPNNHILHTLLVKAFTRVFGYSEFVCRFPNFLGGIMYWIFGLFILNKISRGFQYWVLIGVIFLISNPYVVEFFGLARGYGLSVAWMLVSIFCLISGSKYRYYASLIAGGIAVYTNLTLLNFFIPLFILIFVLQFLQKDHSRISGFGILGLIFMIVIASILIPISKMVQTEQFQYWGTLGFYHDTFLPLLRSSVMGKKYFGEASMDIFKWAVILLTALIAFGLVFDLIKFKKSAIYRVEFQLGYLFLGTIAYNYIQNFIFKVPNLNARTALLFYPLFILASFSMFIRLQLPVKWKMILILPILGLALWHIKTCYNLHSAYEWWFDGDNKKVMKAIAETHLDQGSEKIKLRCDWIFQPSLTYYAKIKFDQLIEPPPYNKAIDTTELADFYYITQEDKIAWFDRNYVILKSFAWDTRYLMKKSGK